MTYYAVFDMNTHVDLLTLRERIPEEEFDYRTLMHALREYVQPRNRISALLRDGSLLRVKKGLYVFGKRLRGRPVSRELLSNLIHGPSYVSREYALRFHGLIPEEVHAVTAMTSGRSRRFNTALGLFDYSSLPLSSYAAGVYLASVNERQFFIASAEKALADLVYMQRGLSLRSIAGVERFLRDNLRIDSDDVLRLNASTLRDISACAANKRVRFFSDTILRFLDEAPHE
jgi:predicted transcriptional regulator of viral defense system